MPKKKTADTNEVKNSFPSDAAALWVWKPESSDKWITFPKEHQEKLHQATQKSQKTAQLKMSQKGSGKTVQANFEKMVLKNTGSRKLDNICFCSLDSSDSAYYSWSWQDSETTKTFYPASTVQELETAREKKLDSVSCMVKGKPAIINVSTCTQTVSGVPSKVFRERIFLEDASACVMNGNADDKSRLEDKEEGNNSVGNTKIGVKRKKATSQSRNKEAKAKTSTATNKIPVDPECNLGKNAQVFCEGDHVYDAMLNQTNVEFNNNKYYLLQVLEFEHNFYVWFRWGRVGLKGQHKLINCYKDVEKAKQLFEEKFLAKTKNEWENRAKFKKVKGLYDLLKMDHKASETLVEEEYEKEVQTFKKVKKDVASRLHPCLRNLIELICDVKEMEAAVTEMKFDARKSPLGKLTSKQIKAGYAALKKIEKCIKQNVDHEKLLEACNEFYTRIPHDFGMKRPPLIKNQEELCAKIKLLEALSDIQVALQMIREELENSDHPIDRHYFSLDCELDILEPSSQEFEIVSKYLTNTHAPTHKMYSMNIINIFRCHKKSECENFLDLGNRKLLWHGSRLTNWVGILKQGLRIAPPEAPVTGYMFGKGIYFADASSKSANYCCATMSKSEGLLLLCEVSLGESRKLVNSDYYADRLPAGKHSVMGMGKWVPDPKDTLTMDGGAEVPYGRLVEAKEMSPSGYTLQYNEYIVYSVQQVKMRYLVRVKFNYSIM